MNQPENDQRFTELLQQHHTRLFGYLYAIVHDLNDAEDLYQQTSLVLWKKFGEYQEGTSFFNWAMTAARYEMLNFMRVRKRRQQFSSELRASLSNEFDELNDDLLQARLEALQHCKELLGDNDRHVLEACYGNKRSFSETADHLGRSPKSVYRSLERSREMLMKCIEDRLRRQRKDL